MKSRKVKGRTVAYKLYNGKKALPGFVSLIKGHLVWELDDRKLLLASRVGYGDPSFLSCFPRAVCGKIPSHVLVRYGATRFIKVIVEQTYVQYK